MSYIFAALGRCTVNITGTTLVAQYFDKRRGRALAISNTAHGIGGKNIIVCVISFQSI